MPNSPLGNVGMVAVSLYVADLDAALAWYAGTLGLAPMAIGSDGHQFAAFSVGGAIVVLEPIEAAIDPATRGAENTTLNVMVDRDPVEVRNELLERGVACSDIVESNYVSFLIRDPDGNRFYISRAATAEAQQAVETTTAKLNAPD